jgi:nonribosomal peptide synthetase MxcG
MSVDPLSVTLSVYRQVLGNPEVSPDDDFFELGGDSMQAIDAVSIIESEVGVEIPAAWFFTYPTAAELASAITDAENA